MRAVDDGGFVQRSEKADMMKTVLLCDRRKVSGEVISPLKSEEALVR
jgi:hypothetical protein